MSDIKLIPASLIPTRLSGRFSVKRSPPKKIKNQTNWQKTNKNKKQKKKKMNKTKTNKTK